MTRVISAVAAAAMFVWQPSPGWSLADQYGRTHTEQSLAGRSVVYVLADRGSAEASVRWSRALAGRLAEDSATVAVVRVADLRAAPRAMRRFLRGRSPTGDSLPVLLDFDGVVARRWPGAEGQVRVVVLAPSGRLMIRREGEVSNAAADSVVTLARSH